MFQAYSPNLSADQSWVVAQGYERMGLWPPAKNMPNTIVQLPKNLGVIKKEGE